MTPERSIESIGEVQVRARGGELITVTFEEYQVMLKAHFSGKPNSPTYKVRPRPTANCDFSGTPDGCMWHEVWSGSANECTAATANLKFPKSPENANLLAECLHHT